MSILIKGMQIPDNCDVCLFADWSNLHQTLCCKLKKHKPGFQDYSTAYRTQRSNICPLVGLPEHHGDLIDRKTLQDAVLKWLPPDPCGREEKERPFETDICVSMMMEIEEQEAIIEAEGAEE